MTTSEAEARVGTWIREKYRIDRVLGEGGMAIVYAATHKNKKRFAIKMLRRAMSGHDETRARFVREGYVANTVAHPAAVAVLDEDVAEDGSAFLVMELLEGENVETLARAAGGRLPAEPVLAIALRALDALAAAHARGIVHRDIKPANLFVTHAGELKILDFGIARLRDGAGSRSTVAITQTGAAMMGTPAFMSPEQALGKASLVDHRTDVWAVGATMFSLLAGRHVHQGETLQELLVLTATRPAPSIADVVAGVDPRVAHVIDRALTLDRDARWGSAASMRDAVAAAHEGVFGAKVSAGALTGLTTRAPLPEAALAPTGTAAAVSIPATLESPRHVERAEAFAELASPAAAKRSASTQGDPFHSGATASLVGLVDGRGGAPAVFGDPPAPLASPALGHFASAPAERTKPEGRGPAAPKAPASSTWFALIAALGVGAWIVTRNVSWLATPPRAGHPQAAQTDSGAAPLPAPAETAEASFSADPRAPTAPTTTPVRPRPGATARPPPSARPRSSAPSPFDHQ